MATAAAATMVTACTPRRALPPMVSTGSFPFCVSSAAKYQTAHPVVVDELWQQVLERR
jgi:hypothetical protein